MKQKQTIVLSENEWKIFQHVKPGKRFEIVFTTNEYAQFYPSLCSRGTNFGYELDCFMDVDITASRVSKYDVYLRCVNFMTFFGNVLKGMTGCKLEFHGAYDKNGENVLLIEADMEEGGGDSFDDKFSQEELAKLYRLVYVVV